MLLTTSIKKTNVSPFEVLSKLINELKMQIECPLKGKKEMSCKFSTSLDSGTFQAPIQTTQVLIDLSNYLINGKGLNYVLLGHISAYYLEGRFGWYRQSSRANYNISVLQILQAEKTIRIRSLINHGFKMPDLQDIFVNINKGSMLIQK